MKTTDTELAIMVEQANAIISEVKEPVGYPGWWSQQHLFSMIASRLLSTRRKINLICK